MKIKYVILFVLLKLLEKVYFTLGVLRRTIIKPKKVDCPVVSVGNLVFGGSGKTALVLSLANWLKELAGEGGVILKGYKGKRKKDPLIVSDGYTLHASLKEAGDEAFMLASELKGVKVAVGKNRYKAALELLSAFQLKWILIDDGFSQPYLKKDLDIVLLTGDEVLSSSKNVQVAFLKREPISSLKRAHALFMTYSIPKTRKVQAVKFFKSKGITLPIFEIQRRPFYLKDLATNVEYPLDVIKDRKCLAFAGIARPERFFDTLKDISITLVHRAHFKDHQAYSKQVILSLIKKAQGEPILCTPKDAVKLRPYGELFAQRSVYALYEQLTIIKEELFLCMLMNVLGRSSYET